MFRRILQSKWFTTPAVILIGFLTTSLIKIEPDLTSVYKELDNLNKKISEAKKSDSEAQLLSDYTKSDSYLERQARLKLNYKKPDEKVVYVYSKKTAPQNIQKTIQTSENKLASNLKSWWRYLINE